MTGQRRKTTAQSPPRRRLRAAFVADIENYSGRVSIAETIAYRNSSAILEGLKKDIKAHNGDIINIPGDGMVALFESAVEAVRCALAAQARFSDARLVGGMQLRIGIHLGEVIIEGLAPLGEAINVSARLQSLAEPGSILVTEDVFSAVAPHVSARFEPLGVPRLRNIPRRFPIFRVLANEPHAGLDPNAAPLDQTTKLPRRAVLQDLVQRKSATLEVVSPPRDVGGDTSRTAQPERPRTTKGAEKKKLGGTTTASQSRPAKSAIPIAKAASLAIGSDVELELVHMLAKHVGPLAPVLFKRAASSASTVEALVASLENAIPNEKERAQFHAAASRLVSDA